MQHEKVCLNCKNNFTSPKKNAKFCSYTCCNSGIFNPMYGKTGTLNPLFGQYHTEDTCKKIGLSNIGKHSSKKTEETKQKMSESALRAFAEGRRTPPMKRLEVREKVSKKLRGKLKSKESVEKQKITKSSEKWIEEVGRESAKKQSKTKHSDEWIEKVGKEATRKHKETVNSEEWKEKIGKDAAKRSAKTQKRNGTNRGEKNHFWRGGISFEPYGVEFNGDLKEFIRRRDNYLCQECHREQSELRTKTNRPYKLMIHHIDFNKKNNNPNNLISLCRNCHMQTNYNREKWIGYYQDKMNNIMPFEVK